MRSLGGGFQPVGVDEVSLIQLRVEQVPAMIIGRSDNTREKHDVVACQCTLDFDTPFIMVNQPHASKRGQIAASLSSPERRLYPKIDPSSPAAAFLKLRAPNVH